MRTVLITGVSSGIGLAAAELLLNSGFKVIGTTRCASNGVAAALISKGVHLVEMDLNSSTSVDNALQEILMHLQGTSLSACFANAGYGLPVAFVDLTRELLEQQFSANLFGHVQLLNGLIKSSSLGCGGKILWNSSILGYSYLAKRGAYCASKYAMEGLANVMRLELSTKGIAVVLIEPGPISSNFRANALSALRSAIAAERLEAETGYRATVARLAKVGPPNPGTLACADVADVVLKALLAKSPRARYRVTTNAKTMAVLARLLPTFLLDKVLLAASGPERH